MVLGEKKSSGPSEVLSRAISRSPLSQNIEELSSITVGAQELGDLVPCILHHVLSSTQNLEPRVSLSSF